MPIYCVTGKQRNGKTAFGSNIAYSYAKKSFIVVSNVSFKFPYIPFTEDMFVSHEPWDRLKKKHKTNRIFVYLADAHLLLASHKAKKDSSKMWFCTQILKILEEKGHFMYDTQNFFQMNKTLRANTDTIFHIQKRSRTDEPLEIEVNVMEDRISQFISIHSFVLSEADGEIRMGLFDRWKPTEISERYLEG